MPRKQDPARLTAYLCWFCGERIAWGEILRVLRTDPGQSAFEEREIYAHLRCLIDAIRAPSPLAFKRFWDGKGPKADDSAEIEGQPCCFCAKEIAKDDLTRLRLQALTGTAKAPSFNEESFPAHRACIDARLHRNG